MGSSPAEMGHTGRVWLGEAAELSDQVQGLQDLPQCLGHLQQDSRHQRHGQTAQVTACSSDLRGPLNPSLPCTRGDFELGQLLFLNLSFLACNMGTVATVTS